MVWKKEEIPLVEIKNGKVYLIKSRDSRQNISLNRNIISKPILIRFSDYGVKKYLNEMDIIAMIIENYPEIESKYSESIETGAYFSINHQMKPISKGTKESVNLKNTKFARNIASYHSHPENLFFPSHTDWFGIKECEQYIIIMTAFNEFFFYPCSKEFNKIIGEFTEKIITRFLLTNTLKWIKIMNELHPFRLIFDNRSWELQYIELYYDDLQREIKFKTINCKKILPDAKFFNL